MKCNYCKKKATYTMDVIAEHNVEIRTCDKYMGIGLLMQKGVLHGMMMKEKSIELGLANIYTGGNRV